MRELYSMVCFDPMLTRCALVHVCDTAMIGDVLERDVAD